MILEPTHFAPRLRCASMHAEVMRLLGICIGDYVVVNENSVVVAWPDDRLNLMEISVQEADLEFLNCSKSTKYCKVENIADVPETASEVFFKSKQVYFYFHNSL